MQKYIGLTCLSIIFLSLSFPTNGYPFFIFLGFVPLLFLDDIIYNKYPSTHKRRLMPFVYLTFFMFNAISIWWLHNAKHPNGNFAWEAYFFAVAANAALMSVVFWLYSWTKKFNGEYIGSFFFIFAWISFEKLHLEWEFTFPWFNLGNIFATHHKLIQWYDITGALGGTLWILIINFIIYHGIKEYLKRKKTKYLYRAIFILIPTIFFPILSSFFIYNSYVEKGNKINVTIIQPDLDPYTQKYTKTGNEILEQLLELTKQNVTLKTDFVVYPETAFPGKENISINEINTNKHLLKIKQFLKKYPRLSVISGTQLIKFYGKYEEIPTSASNYNNEYYDFYNSAIQLNNQDSIKYYQKSKLVPGVEIFPYINYLKPLLGNLMLNFGGAVISLGIQEERIPFTNKVNNAVIAPIICYEAIYGEFITDFIKNKANVLFMLSNDSWWGDSDGYKELFLFSRLRAIENRRSIVRSANSGISAIINQRGDVIEKLDYNKKGAIKGLVQLNEQVTVYANYGDYIARFALLITGIFFTFTATQKILQKK